MKGKERGCQIKGMVWLDNEAAEVNISASATHSIFTLFSLLKAEL